MNGLLDLRRHKRALSAALAALRNHGPEAAAGIIRPVGIYTCEHRRGGRILDAWSQHNILPDEGLTLILNLLGNHTSGVFPALYIALYATAVAATSSSTGASFPGTSGEITSGTDGYTQSTRVAWVSATATTPAMHNNASPATFTIATTGSDLLVNGIAMYTTSGKGNTAGKIASASQFTNQRAFANTDEFDVKYQLGFTSA